MAAKPSIPKGTRDFSPVEMAKRNYIFNTIRDVYHLYGFQQIETPSMEMLSTLMGKYGDEGDKLLFKIQNSGDYFSGITDEELLSRNAVKLASKFCEKGLRYDLTVPFARYVVMHRDEITFPFKRYQIQPVWRADRPQKGRYREFYQCDADVVGSDSLLNEVELMQIVDTVFSRFNIRVCIKINNRKILSGIAEIIGESDKIVDITVAIDKLDKIGLDNVNAELKEKGISDEAIAKLQPIILLSGTNAEKLATLKNVLSASEVGLKGVEESEFILNTLETMGLKNVHRDEITFPFKRYQIQPVWRADRPQKGRYREFYQCDADVVGSDSLLNEVELMQIVDTVFSRFNIRVCIKINNRKILSGIAEIIGESDKIVDITVAIDKLDKIGLDNVNAELKEKGISDEAIAKLQPIILLSGTNAEKLATLKNVLSASEVGLKGVEESEFILNTLETMGLKNEIELDLTLARGLNYYTGAIFEVKALDVQIGSITGGGRYDNLTGVFGMAGVSGVGISFGADRIFDVLNQLELYPKEAVNGTELLFINFGEKEAAFSMGILSKVRAAGIRAEIFPDAAKMKKQMSYANTKNIPFVAIVGENEMNEGKAMLKNMETGEQNLVSAEELIAVVKK